MNADAEEDFYTSIIKDTNVNEFYGSTLILPSVSIGNVAQLTIDLIIHTLEMKKIGYFNDEDIVPVVGSSENIKIGQDNVVLPLELYYSSKKHLCSIQIRSPILRENRRHFINQILTFCDRAQIYHIILLTSIDGAYRFDSQLSNLDKEENEIFRHLTTSTDSPLGSLPILERDINQDDNMNNEKNTLPIMRHGGIARDFISIAFEKKMKNVSTLISFVIEGDNIPDALKMADKLDFLINLKKEDRQWVIPKSWEKISGNSTDQILY